MKTRFLYSLLFLLLLSLSISAQDAPPKEEGKRKPDLVELINLDPTFKLDIRYATSSNFVGKPVYAQARAFLQRPAAEALVRVNKKLKEKGYGLMIFDGYRPWYVTKFFWDITPEDKKKFVADPSKGSRHNRGCAVDLTLYDLKTGMEVQMTGYFDEFSERSHPNYQGGTEEQRAARDLLRKMMESEGFTVYEEEWWHFDYKDWREYPILNLKFSEIEKDEPLVYFAPFEEMVKRFLDAISERAQTTHERVIVVAHLNKKEDRNANQRFLNKVRDYFENQRGLKGENFIFTEGDASQKESRLDFYFSSKYAYVMFFKKGRFINKP